MGGLAAVVASGWTGCDRVDGRMDGVAVIGSVQKRAAHLRCGAIPAVQQVELHGELPVGAFGRIAPGDACTCRCTSLAETRHTERTAATILGMAASAGAREIRQSVHGAGCTTVGACAKLAQVLHRTLRAEHAHRAAAHPRCGRRCRWPQSTPAPLQRAPLSPPPPSSSRGGTAPVDIADKHDLSSSVA